MKLLLDTHIVIWSVNDDERLPEQARRLIESASTIFVSVVSIWEIAIKSALTKGKRGDMPFNGYRAIDLVEQSGYDLLAIEPHHAAAVGSLPHHHDDPFDRLLVTQALSEGVMLVTHNSRMALYGDYVALV